MAKPETFEEFQADLQARQKAVASAGWKGLPARVLALVGNNRTEFDASLSEANTMLAIANMVRPRLEEMDIDVDYALEQSIIHRLPLAEVRSIIIQRLAERDEATHTDTSPPFAKSAGDIYADRKAQMKAANVR